ncbi:hypothetical protein swp_0350 [Shewanella piezotolerans WP3]|uniref:Uncharacterized protein n=1 Tax=Shewanella piezotolerans (strain WP3 / JCM 13877) TaxID=225849 RepID=B8CHQ9_SHEPW|nr:hypothetical protein swp_0350 [Shewanella piezotolerans WP3]
MLPVSRKHDAPSMISSSWLIPSLSCAEQAISHWKRQCAFLRRA